MKAKRIDEIVCHWTLQTGTGVSEKALNQLVDTLAAESKNDAYSKREMVGIAIGEASMCWSETPRGVFDSTRASELVDRIIRGIE